jgi:hypothetical protein
MRFKLCLVTAFLVASAAAKTFQFTVPLSDLQEWAGVVLTTRAAQVTGHSGVHLAVKDCEMHFGGTVTDYAGTPDGGCGWSDPSRLRHAAGVRRG